MSETVATFDPLMPAGYEKLDGIEVTQLKDGSLRFNGILKLGDGEEPLVRRVQIPDPVELWGYDTPEWDEKWEQYKANPELWAANKRIEALENKVAELTRFNQSLEKKLDNQTKLIEDLTARLEERHVIEPEAKEGVEGRTEQERESETPAEPKEKVQPKEATARPSEVPDEPAETDSGTKKYPFSGETVNEAEDFSIGDRVAIKRGESGYEPGYVVEGFDKDDEGNDRVIIRKFGKSGGPTKAIHPQFLIHNNELKPKEVIETPPKTHEKVEPKQAVTESDNRLKRRRNRFAGALGVRLLRRQVELQNGVYNYVYDRGRGRHVVVEEEVIDGYPASSVEVGNRAAVGGAALIAAGVVLAWVADKIEDYFEARHGVPKTGITRTIIENPPKVTTTVHEGIASGGSHIDFYNSASGHRLTGVELPANLHLHGAPGNEYFVDNNGHTVLSNAKWDRQGNLSHRLRTLFRAKRYILGQGRLGQRYMTVVGDSE